jgi:hypothetical protein
MTPRWFLTPVNLAKQFENAASVAIRTLASGRKLELWLVDPKSKRTGDQNRRLWVLLHQLAAIAWVDGKQYSAEVWHEHLKRELLGVEEIPLPNGQVQTRGISTTTLTVSEMATYMDRIEQWAAENGWPLMEGA